tara:strand:+ start:674 stop:1177 length:504 start_codon:yes stop_codon:yes gene_type:complete
MDKKMNNNNNKFTAKSPTNFYVYGLAVSTEINPPQHNASRVSLSTWDDLKRMGSDYCVYVGISRLQPSERLSKHQSKKAYSMLAPLMGFDNFDSKNLCMYVLADHMNYKLSEWPLVMSIEARLISEFASFYGHEPLFQLPPPDSGIKKEEALKLKELLFKRLEVLTI